jgi:hypothetical protein
VNNPVNAGASLAPLIAYVKQHLTYQKWNSTPISNFTKWERERGESDKREGRKAEERK